MRTGPSSASLFFFSFFGSVIGISSLSPLPFLMDESYQTPLPPPPSSVPTLDSPSLFFLMSMPKQIRQIFSNPTRNRKEKRKLMKPCFVWKLSKWMSLSYGVNRAVLLQGISNDNGCSKVSIFHSSR